MHFICLRVTAFLIYDNANSTQRQTLSQLCVLRACNLSRKVGSVRQGQGEPLVSFTRAWWPQLFWGPVWSLNRRPRGHWGGNWCQHSCVDCRYCQFPLIAVEVPPSVSQPGKHLVLIALCIYKSSMCKYGELLSKGPGGVSGLCKWPFPEFY